jgi:hypothetical protein
LLTHLYIFFNFKNLNLGLLKLLHVATQIPEQYDYPVSAETRQHMAICLSRLNDDMVFDNRRAIYKERVDQFFGYSFLYRCAKQIVLCAKIK